MEKGTHSTATKSKKRNSRADPEGSAAKSFLWHSPFCLAETELGGGGAAPATRGAGWNPDQKPPLGHRPPL